MKTMMMMIITKIIIIIMMMMTVMMMIIVVIILAFKETFYNLFTAPRTVSNMYAQVAGKHSCSNHVQHIGDYHVQHVVCHLVQRDSSAIKFDRV